MESPNSKTYCYSIIGNRVTLRYTSPDSMTVTTKAALFRLQEQFPGTQYKCNGMPPLDVLFDFHPAAKEYRYRKR